MGVIRSLMVKAGEKAGDKIAKLSKLSPEQVQQIQALRELYLNEMPDPNDETATEMTEKLLAASSVEIYNAYLPQIKDLYLPMSQTDSGSRSFNVRYLNITKWVTDKKENSLEKLVNVYNVLSDEDCNIALIFNRTCETTNVYLGVSNKQKQSNHVKVDDYINRLENSLRGNFPGSVWDAKIGEGTVPCLDNNYTYSVSSVSNIPAEKSEKFISQTIEKILDGVVPATKGQEYTIVLLATPIRDLDERKLAISDFYTGLAPYAAWQTNFTFVQSDATSSMAVFGVNAGVSAGIQNGTNQALTNTDTVQNSTNRTETDTTNDTYTDTKSKTLTDTKTKTDTESISNANGITNTDGKSSTKTITDGTSKSDSNLHGPKFLNPDGSDAQLRDMLPSSQDPLSALDIATGKEKIPEVFDYTKLKDPKFLAYQISGLGSRDFNVNALLQSAMPKAGINLSSTNSVNHSLATAEGTTSSVAESMTKTIMNSAASSAAKSVADATSKSVANSVGRSVAQSLGRAVSTAVATTQGITKNTSFGGNFGANFARSSNVTVNVGKNEGITQSFTNYNIKHALELLENQMKRFEKGSALGMWDFAAYVISEDHNIASNVAHSYLALTQGEESFLSKGSINTWRGDVAGEKESAHEICNYIRDLDHPIFALNPLVLADDETMNCYPSVVTATTGLTGKELAYSLNFPLHSISGLPILKCAEFGRNVVSYDLPKKESRNITIGKIFHMNRSEPVDVSLSLDSLSSHVFITGSTGSGKSNTVYKVLDEAIDKGTHFLVVEPAKGEYKNVFASGDVNVFGTNPQIMPLLKINPFKFPKQIHILEHLDRLIEIFNVCWPMYAAMPAVLKNAIEKSYEDCGWDLVKSTNEYSEDLYPKFKDVTRNIKTIIESSEYDAENKGAYKGALITRLQSLSNGINGLIFDDIEIDQSVLFDQNTIIDLSRVGSSETKSLLMGLIVLKLQEYRMSNQTVMNTPLKHITVLEEAHNLLKRTSTEQPVDGGNLLGKSVEMLTNAIAEMRTYGEGFIIVDQAPGLLDLSVIRNTNTKIIMRLPEYDDRQLVGRAANLDEDQINELAKLRCGVGAIYQNEWIQPVLCEIDKVDTTFKVYEYTPNEKEQFEMLSDSDRLTVAELLCKGVKVGREAAIKDIMPSLAEAGVDASVQVAILRMLENPAKEPKMTKLAPIFDAIFPDVMEAVKTSFAESSEQKEWTQAANSVLVEKYQDRISDQTRRDIIQGIMTYYLLNILNKIDVLEDWSNRGGLS